VKVDRFCYLLISATHFKGDPMVNKLYQHLRWIYWSARRAHCILFHLSKVDIVPDYRTPKPGQTLTRGDFLTCIKCVHVMKQLPLHQEA
jgi:hypothetical protein